MTVDYDVVGVGIGPSNLSLAALLEPHSGMRTRFYERRPEFQWHEGLLFPGSKIQVSFIKDLVTLADPTSRFSFLAFLKDQRRLYRFLNAEFDRVDRREFNQYFRWVCAQLDSLTFGSTVDSVTLEDELVVQVGAERIRTRHLVLGVGPVPYLPSCAVPHLGETVFHGYDYLQHDPALHGRRVVVVGGGQTGAEVVERVLSDHEGLPREVWWISRRSNFLPLDESPFVNELFTPSYTRFFSELSEPVRTRLVAKQKLASDGISPRTLIRLTQRLYELEFLDACRTRCHLWPAHELRCITRDDGGWKIDAADLTGGRGRMARADIVVLCTGSTSSLPPCMSPLMERLADASGKVHFEPDYSLTWDAAPKNRIYVQNLDRTIWGIADPNLSLMAWRSAVIANSLLERQAYDTADSLPAVEWSDCDRHR
jgi:lysine N6-hydroxylase